MGGIPPRVPLSELARGYPEVGYPSLLDLARGYPNGEVPHLGYPPSDLAGGTLMGVRTPPRVPPWLGVA